MESLHHTVTLKKFEVLHQFIKKQNMIKKNYQLNWTKKFVDKAQQCFAFSPIKPTFKFAVEWSWFLETQWIWVTFSIQTKGFHTFQEMPGCGKQNDEWSLPKFKGVLFLLQLQKKTERISQPKKLSLMYLNSSLILIYKFEVILNWIGQFQILILKRI